MLDRGGRRGMTDASTVPALVACPRCDTPHIHGGHDACAYCTCMQVNLHTRVCAYVYAYNSKIFCFIKWRNWHQIQAGHIINPRNLDLFAHWDERAATRMASSPLGVLRVVIFDSFPRLLRWRYCHGGGFLLQYVREVIRGVYLMFYTKFVFNFGFYNLWWCMYYHWCLYFQQKDVRFMYGYRNCHSSADRKSGQFLFYHDHNLQKVRETCVFDVLYRCPSPSAFA